ncbi:MAG TPA: hypothetical protein VLC28_02760 [Flavitalea sp.]|nr:hypothetical protein [Flavitalea sp.]
MRMIRCLTVTIAVVFSLLVPGRALAQLSSDTGWQHTKKNVVRYNLSGALLFGFDKSVIVGYERIIRPNQSISINIGTTALPKLVSIITDSFQLKSDIKNKGVNFSVDYRFYLQKENKYSAPRGVYIGPYYSYNKFDRDNAWELNNSSNTRVVSTTAKFEIHTVGAELGYQFILWKKMALDLVLVGPGVSSYRLKTSVEGNLDPGEKEQLQSAIQQLIQQKFPGMNFVFADQEINASGVVNTWNLGFRYLVHIGFNF